MRGYFGLTDPDWSEFFSRQPEVDEVNFWQPHGNRQFRAVPVGSPFFFKLRAPLKTIAGFGFFARFEALPARLAWSTFGTMNGASTQEEMLDRIIALRGDGLSRNTSFQIGCVMISAPVFFKPEEWVAPPIDWPRTGVQQGKTYSLETGEGKRVFAECLDRAGRPGRYWNVEPEPVPAERYGSPHLATPRLGQGLFSLAVREAYGGACAVTHEHSIPALEAAHILPYARGGEHRVSNGILLRSDLHRLYDQGYVTVTPEHKFIVGDRLRDEFRNGRSYYSLSGSVIQVPAHTVDKPDPERLDWHRREVFLG